MKSGREQEERRRGEETRRGEEKRGEEEEKEDEKREEKEEDEDEEEATDIKSNNPHLAGGEKHTHTESPTQKMFLRRKTFQHTICCRNFHTHFLQTGAFTRINFDTQAFLHKGAFTHRTFKRRIFYTP